MIVGVLNLQGAVSEHVDMLAQCQVEAKLIKKVGDLTGIDGIIIPGGESTVSYKLLVQEQLLEPLKQLIQAGLPVFGTCAGLVLLTQPKAFGVLKAEVVRNGFGRQKDSFEQAISVAGFDAPFHGVFIRAPYLTAVDESVTVLATIDDKVIAAQYRHVLVTAFHPELTADTRFHEKFIQLIANKWIVYNTIVIKSHAYIFRKKWRHELNFLSW